MTTKSKKTKSSETANPPIAKIRAGLVTASIWERKTENGSFFAVTFERRYRDKESNWQSSHSYDGIDLLVLAKVADLAHTKVLELQGRQGE